MAKGTKQKPKNAPASDPLESNFDGRLAPTKSRLLAQQKRAHRCRKFEKILLDRLLGQLGVTSEELHKEAESEFTATKADSKAALKQMRKVQAIRLKKRGSMRKQIEAAYFRFGIQKDGK